MCKTVKLYLVQVLENMRCAIRPHPSAKAPTWINLDKPARKQPFSLIAIIAQIFGTGDDQRGLTRDRNVHPMANTFFATQSFIPSARILPDSVRGTYFIARIQA